MTDTTDTQLYRVVINHEEQYSIWPEHKAVPLGWRDAGKSGPKEDCLSHIKQVWTDMSPLSLRGTKSLSTPANQQGTDVTG
jgi:MbtH protein